MADDDQRPGLRERKKAKTRAAIQQEAMRLFRERGYDGATVEEIAEAAEVSPSTFFRYFPTKEDVVLRDDYDERLVQAMLAQPAGLSPLRAAGAALDDLVAAFMIELSPEERELESLRTTLTFTVPQVRARWSEEVVRTFGRFAGAVAERAGLPVDDIRVRTVTGALFGVIAVIFAPLAEDPSREWTELIPELHEALELLERGLPL